MGPPTSLVRPALELAWAVARDGERQHPPSPVPGPMRPLVRFARLPGRALDTVRRTVDDDAGFRVRVAAAADEAVLGRVPWLWLARPDGWAEEIEGAQAASAMQSRLDDDRRAERAAQRRLVVVEVALARCEAELLQTRIAGAARSTELVDLRQERRRLLDDAQRDRAARAAAAEAHAEAERRALSAEGRQREVEQLLAAAEQRLERSEGVNEQLAAQIEAARQERRDATRSRRAVEERRAATTSALGEATAEAAAAANDLGAALGRAAQILAGGPESAAGVAVGVGAHPPSGPAVHPSGTGDGFAVDDGAPGGGGGGKWDPGAAAGGGPRWPPVPLPRAVHDDSAEAAAWLVRLPGVALVVDGYNVTLNTWSGRELPDQRHRLVTALAELSMRTGAQVEVVFDGADDHVHPLRSLPARRAVRVTFSPPAVDADEVIIERAAHLRPSRPVVVATDDRRVRDRCAVAGANLVSTEQLVGLLGRSRDNGRP